MSERWVHVHVMGADPEALLLALRAAQLPVAIRLARVEGGATLLFDRLSPAVGAFLAGLPGLAWLQTEDSIASASRLVLLQDGQTLYEEAVDPEEQVHVRHGPEHRSGPAAAVPQEVAALAREAMAALARAGISPLPVRRIWEGDPFPGLSAEEVAVIPGSTPLEEEGDIPY